MTNSHFQKLERMYLKTKVNVEIFDTITAKIAEGEAEIGLTITDKYFHALDAIHGTVYFKLLDDAAFFAANSVVEDVFVLTSTFNLNLIRPASEGKLKSIGKLRSQSKNLLIAESILYNEQGKEIALGTGTFMKSRVALTPEIGYK
jgi:uncharacterized protein (TIGR00369 family)